MQFIKKHKGLIVLNKWYNCNFT